MIESYRFGKMVIDGEEFDRDVMIPADGPVIFPWWRAAGHELVADDIAPLLSERPVLIVIGAGDTGHMKPAPELCARLAAANISVIANTTREAVREYNAAKRRGERVAGCFHLTC